MNWQRTLNDLEKTGYSVQNDLFLPSQLEVMRHLIGDLYDKNQLRQAEIASGSRQEIRGDYILWLDDNNSLPFQYYLQKLEALRFELNQSFFIGLKSIETHVTLYPALKKYEKHVDNYLGKNSRKLSCILYLNPQWSPEDGGELVIYNDQDHIIQTVEPKIGTFVIFKSEEFPHEVKISTKPRLSITSWFRS